MKTDKYIKKLETDTAKKGLYAVMLTNSLLLVVLICLSVYQLYYDMVEVNEQIHLENIVEQQKIIIDKIENNQKNAEKTILSEFTTLEKNIENFNNLLNEQQHLLSHKTMPITKGQIGSEQHNVLIKLKTMLHLRNLIASHQPFDNELSLLKAIDAPLAKQLHSDGLVNRTTIFQEISKLEEEFNYHYNPESNSIIDIVLKDIDGIIKVENSYEYKTRKSNKKHLNLAKHLIKEGALNEALAQLKAINLANNTDLELTMKDLKSRVNLLNLLNNQIDIILKDVN